MEEKDRLGEKLREAERGREDAYFAKRDRELLKKLKEEVSTATEATLREIAVSRCPKDGAHLHNKSLHGVTVEECPECKGIWLESGELKEITEREQEGWLVRWYRGERD